MESHVAKWLSDNCVDTNATVLQNARLCMDHASNVYKDKAAMYETRGDMERLPPGAANPNAFSETATRLCKAHNDANPNWQAAGGGIRPGRFEYLPVKVAPCGLHARRHHGTKQCEKQNLRFVHEHKKNGDFWHNLRALFFCAAL